MGEIFICEKPDYIDFEEIHQVLYAAHESTRNIGIHYWTADMSGKELESYLKDRNATCLVALDGNKVVGTMSYFIREMHERVEDGVYLETTLGGVLPNYKGNHIYTKLHNKAQQYAKECQLDGMVFGTAASNLPLRKMREKQGYILTNYKFGPKMMCYVVRYYLHFNKYPHSKIYSAAVYQAKKCYVHLKYSKTKGKRF